MFVDESQLYDLPSCFVTGTDTSIGKTLTCASLLVEGARRGCKMGYFKPVQTGSVLDSDSETILRRCGHDQVRVENPVYSLPAPLAPSMAARKEGQELDPGRILNRWREISRDSNTRWLVEGAGGLLVPIRRGYLMADLIREMELPVILATSTRLGTINHTLLTLEALERRKVSTLGYVLFGKKDCELEEELRTWTSLPVLMRINEPKGTLC